MSVKLNAIDKVVSALSPKAGLRRARYRAIEALLETQIRKYEGAGAGRRTKNWKAASSSANTEIQQSLVTLRNRSRQLVRDNAYAAKAAQTITANVVGWGIHTQIKVLAGQSNSRGTNTMVERRTRELTRQWRAWAEGVHCDYDMRLNFAAIQRLVMRGVFESGEIFIRKRRTGARREVAGADGYPVLLPGIQLQVLESDFCDMTGAISSQADPGNAIIQGIEFSPTGQRVAYHFYDEHPGNAYSYPGQSFKASSKTIRVPADEVIHVYRMDRPGQIRGAPWLSPVMLKLKDFDEYEDAQLVRQKVAAMFAVFVKDLDGVDPLLASEGEDELHEKVEPGIIEILPPGKDITLANPPGVQGYGEYSSNVLHAVAAGIGITYESVTGDFSRVNFSSGRMGHLEMSRNIEEWREMLISQFCNPVVGWWMQDVAILGVDTTRAVAHYTAPKREMIDPVKETAALKDQVRSGFKTLSEAIRESGYEPEEHLLEYKADMELLDKYGLKLDTDVRQDAGPPAAQAAQPAPAVDESEDEDSDDEE